MVNPKKSLGQNFLVDQNILKKICQMVSMSQKNIIEIGAGTGNLSEYILLKNPKSLTLIEKDKSLCNILEKKFLKIDKVNVINYDILKLNLEKVTLENSIIIGNLPYNISTQILLKTISFQKWPPKYEKIIFMFQKEVAERINAKKNTSNYGRLSIITNFRLKIENFFNVSRNCFFPKPKIDSTVVLFKPFIKQNSNINHLKNLEKITQVFFSNKRKMINKPLKKIFKDYKNIAKKLKLSLNVRPAELEKKIYYDLAKLIFD
tara:strand:- start:162 stop:947 length:786 start_codon:yes stop_codon:yes gene_type:complete